MSDKLSERDEQFARRPLVAGTVTRYVCVQDGRTVQFLK